MKQTLAVYFALWFWLEAGADFPKIFQKCNRNDDNFHDCCKKAVTTGVALLTKAYPEYNLPSLNPMELPAFPLFSNSADVISGDIYLTNCKIYGVTGTTVEKFEYDFERKKFSLKARIPNWEQQCHYTIKGTILGIPIDSSGLSNLHLKVFLPHFEMYWTEYKIGAKTYMNYSNAVIEKEPEILSLSFDGQAKVNEVISENSEKVYESIRDSFHGNIGSLAQHGFSAFFAQVSMEEAFD